MSLSRVETVAAQLVEEYGAIAKANGYRNDLAGCVVRGIKAPGRVMDHIEVGIDFNLEQLTSDASDGSCFDSEIECYVEARIKTGLDEAEAFTLAESVLHDLKRCTAQLLTKYINASAKWSININKGVAAYRDAYELEGKSVRVVGLKFVLHLHDMAGDFQ